MSAFGQTGHWSRHGRRAAFDPTETLAGSDFRSAKALFVPSLKRDIVPLLHAHNLRREGRMAIHIRRREFIFTLGGAAAAWPLATRAQQSDRMRRNGVLMSTVESDPRGLEYITAFAQGLAEQGWAVGRNVRIEYRWGAGDLDRFRRYAAELIALSPDVVLASAGSIVGAFQQASRTVPIVFVTTIDPVGGGWVESLSRPGTNATGFASFEFSMSGKWLELLKEITPDVKRVAVIRDPSVPAGSGGLAAIQIVAPSLGVELTPVGVRDAGEIERAITAFARGSNGGLVLVGPTSSVARYRDLISRW